jgi:hypothetical protein
MSPRTAAGRAPEFLHAGRMIAVPILEAGPSRSIALRLRAVELIVDLWHLAFANLIQRFAPPSFEVQTEVRLTIEPQRADMLLLRRIGVARDDEKAGVLRTLWPRLGLVTVLEYKSPVDSSFRRRSATST